MRVIHFIIMLTLDLECFSISGVSARKDDVVREKCEKNKLLNKCCPDGMYVQIDNSIPVCTKPKNVTHKKPDFSEISLYTKDKRKTGRSLDCVYTLVKGIMKNESFNKVAYDYSSVNHNYYLSVEGILYEEDPNQYHWWNELETNKFCIDYMLNGQKILKTASKARFWTVLVVSHSSQNSTIYITGLLTSCFFLALVLIVFWLWQEEKVLSEKVQMAYVGSTFGGFFFLAIIMSCSGAVSTTVCICLSYVTYFFLLASFCWMAVMSYDLWNVHRPSRRNCSTGRKTRSMRSKFIWYSVFAWIIPAVMTCFLIVTDHLNLSHIPWFIKPNVAQYGCFIAGGHKLLYLYIPMLILISSNWVFFLLTSYVLWQQYKDSSEVDRKDNIQKEHRKLKNRFLMYLKLSIITGISWILEVASSYDPNLGVWYIVDTYNMLVGFSIFLIFVCNKTTYKKLKRRFKGNMTISRNSTDTEI